jgi:HEAT repeat protein
LLQDEVNDPKILAEVIALTREGDANFRYQAARALRWVKPGPQAETAARAVAELLRNHEPVYETEQAITMSFLHAKTGRTEAIEVLREALKPPHQSSTLTTARAAEALGRFGADARDAIPELVALLGRQEADLRESAAGALGSIGPPAKAAVPALTRLLEDQDLRIRARAAVALWRITARSGPAVPVLAKVLNAPELRQVNGPQPLPAVPMEVAPGVPAIVERFTSTATMPEESLPALVAHALGEMGPAAKPAADALREVARDPDERIRTAAAAALKKIGEE